MATSYDQDIVKNIQYFYHCLDSSTKQRAQDDNPQQVILDDEVSKSDTQPITTVGN